MLLHRGNSCNLIHSIYRRNAQLKGTRLDSIKLSRRQEKRLYAPSCQVAGVTREEEKKEKKGRREGGKGRNSSAMHEDARAYMRVSRDNNLPPLITSTILSPEESALITPPAVAGEGSCAVLQISHLHLRLVTYEAPERSINDNCSLGYAPPTYIVSDKFYL